MKNRRNYLKARKKVFKWTQLCFDVGMECPFCGQDTVWEYERYDARCCISCNKWLDEPCGDPCCPYCRNRPGSPYEAYFYEDMEICSAGQRKDWRRFNYQHKEDGRKRHERIRNCRGSCQAWDILSIDIKRTAFDYMETHASGRCR